MTEKLKTPTMKAGGAKAPPKDTAATLVELAAADDAVRKLEEEQLQQAADVQQAEEPDEKQEAEEPEAQESKVAAKENLKLTPEDEQVLDRLGQLWQPVAILDLKTRHEMGSLLLKTYYSGTEGRAKYGDKVMKIAEIRLDIPGDELHRMKKFAVKFKDLDAFLKDHPDATSWSRVKRDYLPDKKSGKRNKWVSGVEQVTKFLDAMLKDQVELKKNVSAVMLEEFSKKLVEANQVVALVIIPGQVFDTDGNPIGVQEPVTT